MEQDKIARDLCRRCGEWFDSPDPEPQYVCDECLRRDWEEAGDLPEHDDLND